MSKCISILILIFAITPAHAGRWSDFCRNHFITDDPYQFQQTSSEWLARQYLVRAIWGTKPDPMLKLMGRQLRFNHKYVAPLPNETLNMLEQFKELEGGE